jgi:hypothetical protein
VRSQSFTLAFLCALILSVPAAGASVVYDFVTPEAQAALSGEVVAVFETGGIPLEIQAGIMDHDGSFVPGDRDAVLAVRLVPVAEEIPGVGLGVRSSGHEVFPHEGLNLDEGLVFHFSPLFEPTRIHLSGITLGGPEGGGEFEAVRLFANGVYLRDVPGEPDNTLTIPLPAGISSLGVMPLFMETPEIPHTSDDSAFFVAAIEGDTLGVGVVFDLKPGSCDNPLNTKSKGVLPAAILGTAALNVSTINPATIRLAGVAPVRWSIEDVGRPGSCAAGPDGIPDLVLKFDTQKVVRALQASMGTLRDRQRIVLPLEGRLKNGTLFVGEDVARLQVPGKGKK